MDVILHCGAHRCATESFRLMLARHEDALAPLSLRVWAPERTRALLNPVADPPRTRSGARRAAGRVGMNRALAARSGARRLIVSDAHMLGSPGASLRARDLYPQCGERMARIAAAFGPVTRVVLQIRSPETWWRSVLAERVMRGFPLPGEALLADLAACRRTWRSVITDLACACPGAEICVTAFEQFAPEPGALLGPVIGAPVALPRDASPPWAHRGPTLRALRNRIAERGEDPARIAEQGGRWAPFSPAQATRLRETYADDLFWLGLGAEGLATLRDISEPPKPGTHPVAAPHQRGPDHDGLSGELARKR